MQTELTLARMAAVASRGVVKDEAGLILPRKLQNPCMQSRPVKELCKEIRWNNKA